MYKENSLAFWCSPLIAIIYGILRSIRILPSVKVPSWRQNHYSGTIKTCRMLQYHHDLFLIVLEIFKFPETQSTLIKLWQTHLVVKQTANCWEGLLFLVYINPIHNLSPVIYTICRRCATIFDYGMLSQILLRMLMCQLFQ